MLVPWGDVHVVVHIIVHVTTLLPSSCIFDRFSSLVRDASVPIRRFFSIPLGAVFGSHPPPLFGGWLTVVAPGSLFRFWYSFLDVPFERHFLAPLGQVRLG